MDTRMGNLPNGIRKSQYRIWIILCALGLLLPRTTVHGQDLKNIAALDEGGHVVFFCSQSNDSDWKAENLLDGSIEQGWSGRSNAAQSVVIAFKDTGLAEIHDILINPYTRHDPGNWARALEFQVSTTYPFRDFRDAGAFTLDNEGVVQVFSFSEPVQARYLKIRFLSNYGGGFMQAGEVQVMGRLLPGIPAPAAYTNVVVAGAHIERYTSQSNEEWAAANLLEEDVEKAWSGKSNAAQEVVIALRDVTTFTDVSLLNYTRHQADKWANDVAVEVSTMSPYKDFTPIGERSMPPIGDLYTLSLQAPVSAKYVKVLFRTNHGGGTMQANGIRLYRREVAGGGALSQQLEETGRAVIHDIHFAFNSADILPASEAMLRRIATVLQDTPASEWIIEGHTDNVGGDAFNMDLSRQRAEAVKRWLVDHGRIDGVRLASVGHGLRRPIADNGTEEGRAQNRRVELVKKQ